MIEGREADAGAKRNDQGTDREKHRNKERHFASNTEWNENKERHFASNTEWNDRKRFHPEDRRRKRNEIYSKCLDG